MYKNIMTFNILLESNKNFILNHFTVYQDGINISELKCKSFFSSIYFDLNKYIPFVKLNRSDIILLSTLKSYYLNSSKYS